MALEQNKKEEEGMQEEEALSQYEGDRLKRIQENERLVRAAGIR
jgi:hypothetical protein